METGVAQQQPDGVFGKGISNIEFEADIVAAGSGDLSGHGFQGPVLFFLLEGKHLLNARFHPPVGIEDGSGTIVG